MFTLSPALQCVVEPGGRVLRQNPACLRLLGDIRSLGKALTACVHPDDHARMEAALAHRGDGEAQVSVRVMNTEGVYQGLEASVFHDATEGVVYLTGREVPMEHPLLAPFKELYHYVADAHLLTDETGILDCNEATLKLLRCPDKRLLLGKQPAELSPPGQRGEGLDPSETEEMFWARLHREGHARFEWLQRRMDGTDLPIEVLVNVINTGDKPAYLHVWRDLGQHKRALLALAESEALFRTLSEFSPIGIFRTDAVGQCEYTNKRLQLLLGFSAEELMGSGWSQAIHEEDRDETIWTCGQALMHGHDFSREFRMQARNGEVRYVHTRAARVRLEDRSDYVGTVEDVTERKQAEVALRDSERRFRRIVEDAEEGILELDANGAVSLTNRKMAELVGYSIDEMQGRLMMDFLSPQDKALAGGRYERRKEGLSEIYEVQLVHRDGTPRWARVSASPIKAGTLGIYHGTLALVVDLTQRRIEEAERARLAATVEAAPLLIGMSNGKGRVTYLNRAGRRLLGLEGADLAELYIPGIIPPASLAKIRGEAMPAVMRQGVWQGESSAMGPDGHTIPMEFIMLAHRDPAGALQFISTIGYDLSERKEVDRMKNEFVSTVSHELRTPLTSIRGALGLMEGEVLGALSPEVMELLRVACSNTDRLIRLINDLLDLEKMESGRLELRMRALEPSRLVLTTVQGIQGMANDARVKVAVKEEVGFGQQVRGDEDRLVQVLTNLVSNAIKFSPSGGRVEVQLRPTPLQALRFCVRDEGPGIPEESLPKLFGRFQQLDGGDARRKGGTGLGLAISKSIIEQHGGRIGVDSKVGAGSTFWFELPLLEG